MSRQSRQNILTADRVAELLYRHGGSQAAVAKCCGVSRAAVCQFIRRRPKLAQIIEDARESLVDHAESSLLKAVKRQSAWAVCFTLRCLGRPRGYIERQLTEVVNDHPTMLTVVESITQQPTALPALPSIEVHHANGTTSNGTTAIENGQSPSGPT